MYCSEAAIRDGGRSSGAPCVRIVVEADNIDAASRGSRNQSTMGQLNTGGTLMCEKIVEVFEISGSCMMGDYHVQFCEGLG